VAGAPAVDSMETMLKAAGFTAVQIVLKEESREFIKDWLPGSKCEEYVVAANVHANKP